MCMQHCIRNLRWEFRARQGRPCGALRNRLGIGMLSLRRPDRWEDANADLLRWRAESGPGKNTIPLTDAPPSLIFFRLRKADASDKSYVTVVERPATLRPEEAGALPPDTRRVGRRWIPRPCVGRSQSTTRMTRASLRARHDGAPRVLKSLGRIWILRERTESSCH